MKTGRAPRKTNAFATDTNVNEGTITSSPGEISRSSAAISSACVQDVVRSAFTTPSSDSRSWWQRRLKGPSPDTWPEAIAALMYSISRPSKLGRLKGTSHSSVLIGSYCGSDISSITADKKLIVAESAATDKT